MNNFLSLNLDKYRKVFVVGDIHGCFSLLETRLSEVGFDKSTDLLVSVGDLVDRGPESHLAVQYAGEPWFVFVRGNHEDMLVQAPGTSWHVTNGGAWYNELGNEEEQRKFINVLNSGPVVLEGKRHGKTFGFVHADWPIMTRWSSAKHVADTEQEFLMWSRDRVGKAQHDAVYRTKFGQKAENDRHKPVEGVDHIFFGHTPLDDVLTVDNCTWCDTGAVFKETGRFATGKLSILDLDDYG